METFIKNLTNSNNNTSIIGTKKTSLVFTEDEIIRLEVAINNSSEKRSFASHKRDIKKFLLSYFEKKSKLESGDKPKIAKTKKTLATNSKTSKDIKKRDTKNISKKPCNGFTIVKVSQKYDFPSSVYKKDNPDDAAKSAMKGIIKKNNLDNKSTFTFTINSGDKTFKYTSKNGKLESH